MEAHIKQGVIILALKEMQYACAAANLAISIKYHNPKANITLITDGIHSHVFRSVHFGAFDWINEMDKQDYTGQSGICIAKAKLNCYKYSPYKKTLFIDADSLCLSDVDMLFNKLKGYKTEQMDGYEQWITEDKYKSFFGFGYGNTHNTSWQMFDNNKIFIQANKFYEKGLQAEDLKQRWGGVMCDEVFINAAITKLKVDCKTDLPVMYFDQKGNNMDVSGLSKYSFITYFGNKNSTSLLLQQFYDREMFRICEHYNTEHKFKMHEIMIKKLVNNK